MTFINQQTSLEGPHIGFMSVHVEGGKAAARLVGNKVDLADKDPSSRQATVGEISS